MFFGLTNNVISWDSPTYGSYCIDYYRISIWIENGTSTVIDTTTKENFLELNTIALVSCQNHTIQIICVTVDNRDSLPTQLSFTTKETIPISPTPPELITKTKTSFFMQSSYVDENSRCPILIGKFKCREIESMSTEVSYIIF